MSEECEADNTPSCCATCGIAEVDDIKLVPCDECDLLKYCSDECQGNHKAEHKEACKQRIDELIRDELLFKQPESSHMGDCPICCLPLPLEMNKSTMMTCCSKLICKGCHCANVIREKEMRLPHSCPFCRKALPDTEEEIEKRMMKRIEANDTAAIFFAGGEQYNKEEYIRAFEYWTKAAELGDAQAHYKLSIMYHHGQGVEKDEERYMHHLEEAAIGGHPEARFLLGWHENNNSNAERAVKHWIIAASQGEDDSIKMLMKAFRQGFISKDVLAAALRAHKAAVDETKSPQREAVEELKCYRNNSC